MSERMSSRTELIVGEEGIGRLESARVVLAGAGAVGGYVLEGLVRAGVGHIRVIDGDTVSASNLNRQILATVDTLGRPKAEAAAERARSINPAVVVEPVTERIVAGTDLAKLIGRPDVIADAIDTVAGKTALLSYAAAERIPTFSSMGAALRTDPSRIGTAPLGGTRVCPLAAAMRRNLRGMDTGLIACVYSKEPPCAVPVDRDVFGKSLLGSLPTVPAIFGMTLANGIIMHIVGMDPTSETGRPSADGQGCRQDNLI